MRLVSILILLIISSNCFSQDTFTNREQKSIVQIETIVKEQSEAWNNGDLKGFMGGYWNNSSLVFIGRKGLTYGWQQTLNNYLNSYPNKKAMGKLTFTRKEIKVLNRKYVYYIGGWHLEREEGDLEGHFDLLWKKIGGEWKIISDHSS